MVEIYNELQSGSSSIKKGKEEKTGENYLNIWKVNPSYRDIHKKRILLKKMTLLMIGGCFAYTLYSLTYNLVITLGFSSFIVIIFILVFHEQFFFLSRVFSKDNYQPFGNYLFWKVIEDPFTLFYTHKQDNFTVGLRTFSIKIIPKNIHANMKQFIRSLNSSLIPFSFRVVQKPIPNEHSFSFRTLLEFNVYYSISGKISYSKLRKLLEKLEQYSSALRSGLAANFHHFKIVQLTSLEIVDSIRASFIPQDIIEEELSEFTLYTDNQKGKIVPKLIMMIILVLMIDISFSLASIMVFIRIGLIIVISLLLLYNFARDIVYQVFNSKFFGMNDVSIIDLFSNVSFYRFSQAPDTIFFHVEGRITGGVKMVNLKYITPPPICFPSKFYIGLIKEKMPFTSSFVMAPMSYYEFEKEGYNYLHEQEKAQHRHTIKNEDDELQWLAQRAGIWRTIITFSTSCVKRTSTLSNDQLLDLEFRLQTQIQRLKITFKGNFSNFSLEQLRDSYLTSGLQLEALKNKVVEGEGSRLTYVLIQGRTISQLIDVVDEFKKGVDTQIAAEFNSPLQLENLVTVGNTINTEFLEEEIPAGFTLEQLHHLLIMNGTIQNREQTGMKLILELIQDDYPAIIFDFYGEWANLIPYYEDTRYANNFLYFKLGKTFILNPIKSDIKYDKDNIDYLDYMLDAYGLCFKKEGKTMETFRNTIIRNADIDISTLNLDLASKREWEKNPVSDVLIAFLQEFSEQDMVFFRPIKKEQESSIKSYEFVTNDKSIIIDLSQSPDLRKKCFFMMVILSKCIHYLHTEGEFTPKFLVLPHIDLIFDSFHLDRHVCYGMIDKFFQPLTRRGFGLICSSAQTHYLHPNLLNNYFSNYISFKTIDSRDVTQLKNILNLEEIHGQGIYSKSRNESYQIRYLMSMHPEEALIKRSDLHHPFPVRMDFSVIQNLSPMDWSEIVTYMENQGYDLEHTERVILEHARKTIFEKDFGDYSVLIGDIIKFLKNLKTVDKVGNLYPTKVKEELKKALHPILSTITNDKVRIKDIRNTIFDILTKHSYLIENHPKRASGGESIRTTYSVGPYFEYALEDYFNTRHEVQVADIDKVHSESDSYSSDIAGIANPLQLSEEKQTQFKNALAKEVSETLYWELFTLHKHVSRQEHKEISMVATNFVKRFFHRLYIRYYNVNYAVIDRDIDNFIVFMTRVEGFPFTKKQLNHYITNYLRISPEESSDYYDSLYQELSTFFTKLQDFINLLEEKKNGT